MFNTGTYYWISARHNGRLVILGAYDTEDRANEVGFEKLDVPFDVIPLPTKDMTRATRIIKARQLNSGQGGLDQALQRAKHTTQEAQHGNR